MSATGRGSERIEQDKYMTPIESIIPMIEEIKIVRGIKFLEPCIGTGNIVKCLPDFIVLRYCELDLGFDYLKEEFEDIDLIMTNPPFSLAMPFIMKSLKEAKTVVYLLRLNFLGSQKRKQFWQMIPPTHLYVLSKRPKFINNRTDATEYAWFCWDYGDLLKKDKGIYVI